jgi:Cu/Ag efflux pump CusA
VVLGLALMLAVYGVIQLRNAEYDVFPDFAPPRAAIQTEAPGLSAEQVETLVTRPIETQIIGVPGLVSIRSNSIQGLSDITVIFKAGIDIFRARQQLSEAMTGLRQQLPDGVSEPSLTPLTSSTGTVLIAGVTAHTVSPMELRTVADWTIRPRLLAVPGVAQVSVYGGFTKQYQISIDPQRLARFAVAIDEVVAAARRTLGVRGAGFIDNVNQRVVIEASDDAATIDKLAGTVVARRPR